jgi:UDP-N-acetyl-D-mannosaminuronic acid dehydrogenase
LPFEFGIKKSPSLSITLPDRRRAQLNRICVIGLGRIGLPFALLAAKKGFTVHGVDTNPKIVNSLRNGRMPFSEPGLSQLIATSGSRLRPTTTLLEAVDQSSTVLCCVGTRRYATNRPNLKLLYKIFRDLASTNIGGRLIVLRTTVPIGTTRALAGYLAELTGLRADTDFYLAFAPERTVEGVAVQELETLPVVIGAMGQESLGRATDFYNRMGVEVVKVVNPEAAELVKLIDNTFRITRFAFANDIASISERIGVNAYDVIDAANYKYPRNSVPYPSCGVSGYCLTKDPYYLEEAFRPIQAERHFCSIWMNARKSYDFRSRELVGQILRFLGKMGRVSKASAP